MIGISAGLPRSSCGTRTHGCTTKKWQLGWVASSRLQAMFIVTPQGVLFLMPLRAHYKQGAIPKPRTFSATILSYTRTHDPWVRLIFMAALPLVMSSAAQRSRDIWHREPCVYRSRPDPSTSLGVTKTHIPARRYGRTRTHKPREGHRKVPKKIQGKHQPGGIVKAEGLGDGPAHGKFAIAKLRRLRLTLPPDHALRLCACPVNPVRAIAKSPRRAKLSCRILLEPAFSTARTRLP